MTFAAHPLLGVGPDNYRLSYGPWRASPDPDPGVDSNNMYLEVRDRDPEHVGGPSRFLWLLWAPNQDPGARRPWRGFPDPRLRCA